MPAGREPAFGLGTDENLSPEELEMHRIELEEQRLMQEINKVDEVVGVMKNDYDRIRLQILSKKKEESHTGSVQTKQKPIRPPSSARSGREPIHNSNSVAQR